MATSLEKTKRFVDELIDAEDDDLRKYVPGIPIFLIRGLLPFIPKQLPDTPEELDSLLENCSRFVNYLRSDDEPAQLEA